MLSKLESFKVGFLNRCVEDGLSTEEALSRVKEASDCLDSLEKQAENPFNKKGNLGALSPLVSGLLSGAGSTAGSMLVSEAIKKLLGSKKPTAQREKQAGWLGDLVSGGTDVAKYLGNKALVAGLVAPPVLGGLAGYSHSKLTDVDDDDVDDIKKQELIDEYRRQAERLRHSQALMAYKDRRKKRSNVYM